MSFNSPEYLLFLPLVFALHWALPHRFRWALLLAASWLFYFHWHIGAGLLLVGTTLVTWLCARGIAGARRPAARRALLTLALFVCLGCLATFKYAGFFAAIAGRELALKILLPAGISFYTFQTLSYVIDVYRGDALPEAHFGYYALFVAFFPQLVAGPIERPERLLPQLRARRKLCGESLHSGGWLLLAGYFKKLVVADAIAPLVDRVYAAPGSAAGPEIALATLLFGVQIYCDFSGYSDIARGSAKLLGVELSENFRLPYAARSVREFWRRWHVTLTSWFTDYVYIPLGGNRRGLARQLANILIVFLLSGLWHGAGWNFVVWGLLHGAMLTCGVLWERFAGPRGERRGIAALWNRARTFLLVSFAWLFFRAECLGDAWRMLSGICSGWSGAWAALRPALALLPPLICLPLVERLTVERGRDFAASALAVLCLLTAVALAWLAQLAGGAPNAFIYFQF